MYIKPDFSKTYYALNSNHMNMIRLMGESVFTWKINFKHFEIKATIVFNGNNWELCILGMDTKDPNKIINYKLEENDNQIRTIIWQILKEGCDLFLEEYYDLNEMFV